jgi:hypothetical protein
LLLTPWELKKSQIEKKKKKKKKGKESTCSGRDHMLPHPHEFLPSSSSFHIFFWTCSNPGKEPFLFGSILVEKAPYAIPQTVDPKRGKVSKNMNHFGTFHTCCSITKPITYVAWAEPY